MDIIPVIKIYIINPLECKHAPAGVNSFKGGHDHDQVPRESRTKKSGIRSAEQMGHADEKLDCVMPDML